MTNWFGDKITFKLDYVSPVDYYNQLKRDMYNANVIYPSCNCSQCVEARNKKTLEENARLSSEVKALQEKVRKAEWELAGVKDELTSRTSQYKDVSDRALKYARHLDANNNVLRDMLPILKSWLNTWTGKYAGLSPETAYIVKQFIANIEKVLQQ